MTGALLAALQQPLLPGRAAAAAAGRRAAAHRGDSGGVGADPGHRGAVEVGQTCVFWWGKLGFSLVELMFFAENQGFGGFFTSWSADVWRVNQAFFMVFVQNCWLTIWGSVFVVILVNQRQIFRSGDFDPAMARQTQLGVISQPFKDYQLHGWELPIRFHQGNHHPTVHSKGSMGSEP